MNPSHAANQPHVLYSNLQLGYLFDIIHREDPTSLSLECLVSLICGKPRLRKKNISQEQPLKIVFTHLQNIYRKDEDQNVFNHTPKKSVVFK